MVNGFTRVEGVFPLYIKKEAGGERKIYMEILPAQLGELYLLSPTLEGGTGEYPLITFAQMSEYPIFFVQRGRKMLMLSKNVKFRADPKSAIHHALKHSFADSLRATAVVLSEAHPQRKSVLIDFNAVFFQDLAGINVWRRVGKMPVSTPLAFDRMSSSFGQIHNFPQNMEIELKAFFKHHGKLVPRGSQMAITLRYSVSQLPKSGYRPRYADDRVGYFLNVSKDYTNDHADTRYVRYIKRWNLQKKYPDQPVSVPKQPITFWMGKEIPHQYREAVRNGILLWNKAFERAGFSNAIVVKQQPDDAQWDGADVRYSTVRWFLADSVTFAQGPSRANPLTGEIYDANIRVSADMAMVISTRFRTMIQPLDIWGQSGLDLLLQPHRHTRSLQALEQTLNALQRPAHSHHHHHHGHTGDYQCDYAQGALIQAALGWHLLDLRGELANPQLAKKFVDDFLLSIITHEVGHTLGLRHNFQASTLHAHKDLHNEELTRAKGLTNSIMEYIPVNVALPGQKQGQYWQTTLGVYDYWAIEYGYKPLPQAKTPEQELPYLKQIASRHVSDPEYAYSTDEDAFGRLDVRSIDPRSTRWDLGREPLEFHRQRVQLVTELWNRIETKFGTPKYSYQIMRHVFMMGANLYLQMGLMATKYIGGIYHQRDHIGDPGGRVPFIPVPAAKQREALDFLIAHYFAPNAISWSPSMLNKLAPERLWGFDFNQIWNMRLDSPVHQIVLVLQAMPLIRILHPVILDRIQDTRKRLPANSDYMPLDELFDKVTRAIWSEIWPQNAVDAANQANAPTTQPSSKTKPKIEIDSYRRNLQKVYLHLLGVYGLANVMFLSDVSSVARAQLLALRKQMQSIIPHTDGITKAHLESSLHRIKRLLKPIVTYK
jgi:hypothetical protein